MEDAPRMASVRKYEENHVILFSIHTLTYRIINIKLYISRFTMVKTLHISFAFAWYVKIFAKFLF